MMAYGILEIPVVCTDDTNAILIINVDDENCVKKALTLSPEIADAIREFQAYRITEERIRSGN